MRAVPWAHPTGEQQDLARAVAAVAADRCDPAHRRSVAGSPPYWDPPLWQVLATEIGVAGLGVPEAAGGYGGDFTDAAVVIEEAARALLPVPVTAHLLAVTGLYRLGTAAAAEALRRLAGGAAVGAVGVAGSQPRADRVLHGGAAEVFVVVAADAVHLLDRDEPDVSVVAAPSLDLTRPYATLTWQPGRRAPAGDAAAARWLVEVFRVALAVEAVGVARACLDLTVGYLKVREQFGRPIGSFQALAHRVADLAVAVEGAVSAARYAAAVAAAGDDAELVTVAPAAKLVCAEAAWQAAAETIQLHGGVGFTWEHDAHLYFKRATALRALLGSPAEHRRLLWQRSGLQRLGSRGPFTPQ